jgi:hypothetical protein
MKNIIIIFITVLLMSCDEDITNNSTINPLIQIDTSYSIKSSFKTDSVEFKQILFESENVGYAIGRYNQPYIDDNPNDNTSKAPKPLAVIYKTTDAGNSWNQLNKLDYASSFISLDIYSENEWYAAGHISMHKSSDKGLTWSKVVDEPYKYMNNFETVERFNENIITTKKALNALLKFDLNGNLIDELRSWSWENNSNIPDSTKIFDIDFHKGILYGLGIKFVQENDSLVMYDVVLRSEDFGKTWVEKILEPHNEMKYDWNYLQFITVNDENINIISNYRFYHGTLKIEDIEYLGMSDEMEINFTNSINPTKIIRDGKGYVEILGAGSIYRIELGKEPVQKSTTYAEGIFYINNKYYCTNNSSIFILDN